jgi:hypothetical protein
MVCYYAPISGSMYHRRCLFLHPSWLRESSFSHFSLLSEPAPPRTQLKSLWQPLLGQTRFNQTRTSLNGPSTKLPSSAQELGMSYCTSKLFQLSISTLSGLIAYREFSQAGYDVHVFERDTSPGGNWHYTDEAPPNAPVPNADIAVSDFTPSLPPKGAKLPYIEEYQNEQIGEELRRDHRAPKPIWASLRSNVPAVPISCQVFFELCLMDRLLSAHTANYRASMAARDALGYVSGFQQEPLLRSLPQNYLTRNCRNISVHLHHGMELIAMMVIHIFPITLEWNRCRRGTPKMEPGRVGL